uniref:Ubiquitin carboxyl-terminal hydrolase n=1 Tax=Pinguiococcus pyrenoidosus TaxID=172671 RepID=A0A7R9UD96_9STRA|mmetsp:Transcript_6145/g.23909  ORF Transcript_6145/g.23909 Transcript_6145/m.23909 type:complete len:330 (+) Transcript_6145:90-1079(+)
MSDSWCTIESDPGVFTELVHKFGATGVELQEMYSLDDASFEQLPKPVYGLVFLFKWQQEEDTREVVPPESEPSLFFAKQVIGNACATQALINVLLNIEEPDFRLGEELTNFRTFTADFTPELRGASISNSEPIRQVHNSFSRMESMVFDGPRPATADDDVFHFIAYIPFRGKVYELDGLKPGPIKLGEYDVQNAHEWVRVAAPAVEQRIARYANTEVRFNLLAMVRNSVEQLQELIREVETAAGDESVLEPLRRNLADAQARHAQWKEENTRRRHDYVPLCVEVLKVLAEKGHLLKMLETAKPQWKDKAQRLIEAQRVKKEAEKAKQAA